LARFGKGIVVNFLNSKYMNIKRAIGFSILLWVFTFVIWSIIIFIPALVDKMMLQYFIYWVLLVPVVLFLAKWYYKQDPPSVKKALQLGTFALVVMFVLDAIITIPLFIAPQQEVGYWAGLEFFYVQWQMWVSFVWFMALMLFAGWEFDRTFTKAAAPESMKDEE
jgi:hypothetical protein